MIKVNYNPDVLDAIANLSNDEVFTPPKLVDEILDLLPQELFENKKTTFLDPVSKSGVFLREITKRLMKGLEIQIQDKQERANHILQNQMFGIAITELTSLLSRRSVYGTKTANSKYSFCETFEDEKGNIVYERINHTWKDGKCKFCGASQEVYDRGEELETYAYQFIHVKKPEEIFNMKFDVIIGNPPYQLDTGGSGRQAKPIYQKFVEQAKKLNPRYLTMIIPSRWFSGGMGLDIFRKEMLNDRRIKCLVDYTNSKDCFNGVSISGGVCYFLWEKDFNGFCSYTNIHNGKSVSLERKLNEYPVFVRYNEAISIIHKIQKKDNKFLSEIVSSINLFNLASSERGGEKTKNSLVLYHSKGKGFIGDTKIANLGLAKKYKIAISRTISEHAGEHGKDGKFKILAKTMLLHPNEVCTHSYLIIGLFDNRNEATNLKNYLRSKFVRFLILQTISGIDLSKERFMFIPLQDFTQEWTDEKLYKKYGLTQEEIDFIESMIRPME